MLIYRLFASGLMRLRLRIVCMLLPVRCASYLFVFCVVRIFDPLRIDRDALPEAISVDTFFSLDQSLAFRV